MTQLKIKNLKNTYKKNSIYIFKFKNLSILGSYIKHSNDIYYFEISDTSYETLLDIKVIPKDYKINIIKTGGNSPDLKESILFKNFIF